MQMTHSSPLEPLRHVHRHTCSQKRRRSVRHASQTIVSLSTGRRDRVSTRQLRRGAPSGAAATPIRTRVCVGLDRQLLPTDNADAACAYRHLHSSLDSSKLLAVCTLLTRGLEAIMHYAELSVQSVLVRTLCDPSGRARWWTSVRQTLEVLTAKSEADLCSIAYEKSNCALSISADL